MCGQTDGQYETINMSDDPIQSRTTFAVDIAREAGLSIEQLAQSVSAHGLDFDEYREKIRQEVERSKVVNTMVRSRVRVEGPEIEALFAQRFGDQPAGGSKNQYPVVRTCAGQSDGCGSTDGL